MGHETGTRNRYGWTTPPTRGGFATVCIYEHLHQNLLETNVPKNLHNLGTLFLIEYPSGFVFGHKSNAKHGIFY